MEPCKQIPTFDFRPSAYKLHSDSLLSFGKFLELLVYSSAFHIITPPLCEHTGPTASKADTVPSRPGLNIARHFTHRAHRITFTLAVVEEIYNVEVPRVQFARGAHVAKEAKSISDAPTASSQPIVPAEPETADTRRMLKREMRTWWHTLSERIDNLASFPLWYGPPGAQLMESCLNLGTNFPKRYRTGSAVEIPSTIALVGWLR